MAQYDKDEDQDQTPEAADAAMAAAGQEDDDNADLSELSKQDAADSAPTTPDVKSYIAQKYGLGSTAGTYDKMAGDSMADVKAARQKAKDSNYTADMGQSLATIFKGRGKVDPSVYNNIRSQGDLGAQQATQDRQDLLKNYLTANNLGRQDSQDQMAQEKFGWDRQNADFNKAQHDRQLTQQQNEDKTDSTESEFARRIAKTLDPNGSYDDLSATQIKAQLPMVKDIYDQTMKQQDMALRWAQLKSQNDNKISQKDKDRDLKFGGDYNKEKGKFTDATSKIDNTLGMVDQALEGGVSSQLVPLEVARQIAGRLNPQEIAAAGGDPSIMGKLDRLYNKAAAGQMTGTDAQEYRTLLAGQKKHLTDAWNTKSNDRIRTYANTMGRDEKDVRSLLGVDSQPAPAAAPEAKQIDQQDQAALDWLKANPRDPHAAEVQAKLKKKGVL